MVHRGPGERAVNALRLAFGTLTVLPVRAPVVDRRTAGRAMVLAPLVGLVLAGLALAAAGAVRATSEGAPLLAAVVAVAALALLTRGMHLDGLADTVDGLGSGRPAEGALEVMRKGDVGPFGVVALVLALLLQVAAVDRLLDEPDGALLVTVCLVLSRLALPALCSVGVPAARPGGLGATVAGTVTRGALALSVGLAAVLVVLAAALVVVTTDATGAGPSVGHLAAVVVAPSVVTALLGVHCVRRLGGITGDVLGAGVETTLTVALVIAAL